MTVISYSSISLQKLRVLILDCENRCITLGSAIVVCVCVCVCVRERECGRTLWESNRVYKISEVETSIPFTTEAVQIYCSVTHAHARTRLHTHARTRTHTCNFQLSYLRICFHVWSSFPYIANGHTRLPHLVLRILVLKSVVEIWNLEQQFFWRR
jgi:hypothetical protein